MPHNAARGEGNMKTDLPLKRVTHLCATDLLPLLREEHASILAVESLELPASKGSLDTVLHLRGVDGQPYLHLVEWQGWRDPLILWRILSYLAWLGQHRPERPILATIIYLKPDDDGGDLLTQRLRDGRGWEVQMSCVRLWEQDAAATVASGIPGLLTLAPLMRGANERLVEQAAQTMLQQVPQPLQGELLAALGIFAEPLMTTDRFIRMVTKERLMSSDLIATLIGEKVTEYEQKMVLSEERERALYQNLQQMVEETLILRFPQAPARLILLLRTISDVAHLRAVHRSVLQATDLSSVIPLLESSAHHV